MDLAEKLPKWTYLAHQTLSEPEVYFAAAVAEKLQKAGFKVSSLPLKLFSIHRSN